MRTVFMGTPALALPALEATADCSDLAAVVTQPPRRKGRGLKESPSPVALRCREMGVEAAVPDNVRTPGFLRWLTGLEPDLVVVVAYGKILPPQLLEAPPLGCVNLHASLLPELRGAGPIQWAIARGYGTTGVTLMQMDEGMDTGPILLQEKVVIGAGETAPELGRRLAEAGAHLLRRGLAALERGNLVPRPQDEALATYAPLLTREDGLARWDLPAAELYNRLRGFTPWPGLYTLHGGRRLQITEAAPAEGRAGDVPGTVAAADDDGIQVTCGRGALAVTRLKPEGSREMSAGEYLAGHRLAAGDRLGS